MDERRAYPPPERHDVDSLVRHVALADWLVLAIIVLYHVVAPERTIATPLLVAMAAFAAASLLLRAARVLPHHAAWKLALQPWTTVAFVTFVLWHTGGADSPLLSLYLQPIVLAALVLPAPGLVALVGVVAGAYALVAWASGLDVATAAFAGRLFGAIAPFVMVAWLTAQLGTAILGARRRAADAGERDPLTGLANRRVFELALRREHEQATSRRVPYGVLVLDIDGLGRLNAQAGAEAGDAALKLVAGVLKRALRDTDLAARWGGDEFAVLLPGADLASATAAGQRLRSAVHAATVSVGVRTIRCSVHFGAAAGPQDSHEPRDLVAVAELRMRKERESATGARPARAHG